MKPSRALLSADDADAQQKKFAADWQKRENLIQSLIRERTTEYGSHDIDRQKSDIANEFALDDIHELFGVALILSLNNFIREQTILESREIFGTAKKIKSLLKHARTLRNILDEPGVRNRLAFGRMAATGTKLQNLNADRKELKAAEKGRGGNEVYFETAVGFARATEMFSAILNESLFDANQKLLPAFYYKESVAAPLVAYWTHWEKRDLSLTRWGDQKHGGTIRFVSSCLDVLKIPMTKDALKPLERKARFKALVERSAKSLPILRLHFQQRRLLVPRQPVVR